MFLGIYLQNGDLGAKNTVTEKWILLQESPVHMDGTHKGHV